MRKYLIGIDFGTTNSTIAYAEEDDETIEQFPIAQFIDAGMLGEDTVLPSFIYYPLPEEKSKKMFALDWAKQREHCVGKYAQHRGGELPSQLISSPKSWLCHPGVDRRSPLLPFGVETNETKMSPLQACASILEHLREAWDQVKPESPMHEQQVFITVPASFDPSARQLIVEAAEQAKFPEVILLEEPQAAFYAWLYNSGDSWRKGVTVGDHLLVVDIGGGTTDFSLISLAEENGNLQLNRTAVGAHLLLGGDNIDLSLAYLAKGKFEEQGHEIDEWQMQGIVQGCRTAKEKLLGPKPPKSCDITIMGRGSRLIGGSLKVELQQKEVLDLILDGFFSFSRAHRAVEA